MSVAFNDPRAEWNARNTNCGFSATCRIATWPIAQRVSGAILVFAAAAKLQAYNESNVVHVLSVTLPPQLSLLLLIVELLLGLYLILGKPTPRSIRVSLAVFACLLLVSLFQALSGKSGCGCFGSLEVNPWFTFALDALVVASLISVRPNQHSQTVFPSCRRYCLHALAVMVFAASGWSASAYVQDYKLRMADETELVALTPGMPFPHISRIRTFADLQHGRWILIFHNVGCSTCQQMLANLEDSPVISSDSVRGALIDVRLPGRVERGAPEMASRLAFFSHGIIDVSSASEIPTPLLVRLQDGKVVDISQDVLSVYSQTRDRVGHL